MMQNDPPTAIAKQSHEEQLRAALLFYSRSCGTRSLRIARLLKFFEQDYPNLEPADNAADAEEMGLTPPQT